jgi:hypothetical protein
MFQILSTVSYVYEGLKSHQRELVDASDPFYTDSPLRLKSLTACIFGLIGEQLKRGSEPSTHCRGWDLASSQWFIQSRDDLNHPPLPWVGFAFFVQSPWLQRLRENAIGLG